VRRLPGPFPYLEEGLDHPAPGCLVVVSYDTHARSWPAIFDSGADYTSIPVDLVDDFSLRQEGEIEVLGATGDGERPEIQGIYLVNIEFPMAPSCTVAAHPVLGGTGAAAREYILIGRDILNRHRIVFAGPERQFTID
jgi:hypothetical protein